MSDDALEILVVDDESGLADLYTTWLSDEYEVRTAYSGTEALKKMDENVDVVFLDRRMPELSGDEVLSEIREQGYNCYVAMVTGVDPGFNILDMEFDDYLVKSVSQSDLKQTVERFRSWDEYDARVRELFRLTEKRATLEAEQPEEQLLQSDEYHNLVEEIEALQAECDERTSDLDDAGFKALLSTSTETNN
jgi:DNA-binding response OmpR family regulator